MDARAKIPVVAVLAVQFTACKEEHDPIVGVWSATLVDGMEFPYVYEGEGYSARTDFELHIDEDLRGQFWQYQRAGGGGVEFYYDYGWDLEVTPGEGAKYRINISQGGIGVSVEPVPEPGPTPAPEEPDELVLDCEIAGDRMRCNIVDEDRAEIRWERKE